MHCAHLWGLLIELEGQKDCKLILLHIDVPTPFFAETQPKHAMPEVLTTRALKIRRPLLADF